MDEAGVGAWIVIGIVLLVIGIIMKGIELLMDAQDEAGRGNH